MIKVRFAVTAIISAMMTVGLATAQAPLASPDTEQLYNDAQRDFSGGDARGGIAKLGELIAAAPSKDRRRPSSYWDSACCRTARCDLSSSTDCRPLRSNRLPLPCR